jgi:hypothetical protein
MYWLAQTCIIRSVTVTTYFCREREFCKTSIVKLYRISKGGFKPLVTKFKRKCNPSRGVDNTKQHYNLHNKQEK